jgi:hypothetical protein
MTLPTIATFVVLILGSAFILTVRAISRHLDRRDREEVRRMGAYDHMET